MIIFLRINIINIQIILHIVGRAGVEPAIFWSRVRRVTTTPAACLLSRDEEGQTLTFWFKAKCAEVATPHPYKILRIKYMTYFGGPHTRPLHHLPDLSSFSMIREYGNL